MMLITLGNINPAIDRLIDITIEAVYTMQATDNHWLEHLFSYTTGETPTSKVRDGNLRPKQIKIPWLICDLSSVPSCLLQFA
jgi:hypothetical protein